MIATKNTSFNNQLLGMNMELMNEYLNEYSFIFQATGETLCFDARFTFNAPVDLLIKYNNEIL